MNCETHKHAVTDSADPDVENVRHVSLKVEAETASKY